MMSNIYMNTHFPGVKEQLRVANVKLSNTSMQLSLLKTSELFRKQIFDYVKYC
jgi:hypothetical protein